MLTHADDAIHFNADAALSGTTYAQGRDESPSKVLLIGRRPQPPASR